MDAMRPFARFTGKKKIHSSPGRTRAGQIYQNNAWGPNQKKTRPLEKNQILSRIFVFI
jgi:hypothetical protein